MNKIIFSVLIIVNYPVTYARQEIKIKEAAKHEGDPVTICTKIFGATYF